MEVVASLSQGRTAAAQCSLFTYKSVPVIFEPPCILVYGDRKLLGKLLRMIFNWARWLTCVMFEQECLGNGEDTEIHTWNLHVLLFITLHHFCVNLYFLSLQVSVFCMGKWLW